jgi:Domain of unknown function (DUF4253)
LSVASATVIGYETSSKSEAGSEADDADDDDGTIAPFDSERPGLAPAAPTRTAAEALAIAVEHLAFCPDDIWQGYDTMLEERTWLMERFETESLALMPGQKVRATVLSHQPWDVTRP